MDQFGVFYTGSQAFSSALGLNKMLTKKIYQTIGLKSPHYVVVRLDEYVHGDIVRLYREFPQPSVLKPVGGGSSLNVFIARDFESFSEAFETILQSSPVVLVEGYVQGKEATCGVLDNFRGEAYYALPPIEIIPPQDRELFDYEAKYDGSTQEICPSNFSLEEKQEIMRMAVTAHRALGLRHYSRSDFIVSPRGIYILETNTLPGLTEESLLPKAVQAVGCSFSDFLDHVINLALSGK